MAYSMIVLLANMLVQFSGANALRQHHSRLMLLLAGGSFYMIVQPYSGTIMSKSYGVAKQATAIGVRVLNAGGSGSFA